MFNFVVTQNYLTFFEQDIPIQPQDLDDADLMLQASPNSGAPLNSLMENI